MLEPYPEINQADIHEEAEKELDWIKNIITAIRTIRSEMNISPAKQLAILFRKGTSTDKKNTDRHLQSLKTLAKLESMTWLSNDETPPPSATAFIGELEIYIPLAGFINKEEESARLKKEIVKLEKDLAIIENKLKTPQFVDKAPAEVVAKERVRQEELNATIAKLKNQLMQII